MEGKNTPKGKGKGKIVDMTQEHVLGVPMSEKPETNVETIEPYQLRKLQEYNASLGQVKEALGEITLGFELQKDEILDRAKVIRTRMSELEKEIVEKHGKNITIDINTGIINRTDVQKGQ